MKANSRIKTIISLFVAIFVIFGAASCSLKSNTQDKKSNKPKVSKDCGIKLNQTTPIIKDKVTTKEISKEKLIMSCNVYNQGDWTIATLIIKDKAKKDAIKKLADKYAKELQNKNEGKKIFIQAIQNGKEICNITLK